MKENQHFTKPEMKEIRKNLRNNMQYSEARMWAVLQKRQLEGRKFRRQHSIDHFIVDFYCAEEKLVIEIDGSSHNTKYEYDDYREQHLKNLGLTVLSCPAEALQYNMEYVLEEIKRSFKK